MILSYNFSWDNFFHLCKDAIYLLRLTIILIALYMTLSLLHMDNGGRNSSDGDFAFANL